ncbi:hypothetical protein [Levilactobacillus fujinensis]|uniref:TPR repeat-containing protein n=1 Tax=Levilactobacillus fujinensis TaxID=2486024 RepID=A0ABW1TJ63_9LACO|nr:hypothetical protein [Levilactobacillus fujinensis]
MSEFTSPAAREKALEAARVAFETQNWSVAAAGFERLYQDQQTAELNRYLVASLYHDQQYAAAEQVAAEQDGIYLQSSQTFQLRLDVALKNQQFIFAREFCELPVAQDWRAGGLAQIVSAETASQTTLGTTQRVIAKQFYHLGDVSFAEQRQRLERARQLPLSQFMQGVQYLLVDPFLHPLMRSTLLEELLRLRTTEPVQLHWLDDQVYTVQTKNLRPVNASLAAAEMQHFLQDQLGQSNPVLAANVQQVVTLQLMMLYPFIDKVVTLPVLWVQILAGLPLPTEVSSTDLNRISDWQERLNHYSAELFGAIGDEKHEKP